MTFTVGEILFQARIRMVALGGTDLNGEWRPSPWGPRALVEVEEHVVDRLTPRGAWARHIRTGREAWVSRRSRRFRTTRQEALEQLVHRKEAHVRHAKGRLRDAENGLRAARVEAGWKDAPP